MNNIKKELNKLTKKELINLIDTYDTYIIEFFDNNQGYKLIDDVCPACLMEFFDNEYQEIKANLSY